MRPVTWRATSAWPDRPRLGRLQHQASADRPVPRVIARSAQRGARGAHLDGVAQGRPGAVHLKHADGGAVGGGGGRGHCGAHDGLLRGAVGRREGAAAPVLVHRRAREDNLRLRRRCRGSGGTAGRAEEECSAGLAAGVSVVRASHYASKVEESGDAA